MISSVNIEAEQSRIKSVSNPFNFENYRKYNKKSK